MNLKFVLSIFCLLAAFVLQNVDGQRLCEQPSSEDTFGLLNSFNNKRLTIAYFIGATVVQRCLTFTFSTLPYNQWSVDISFINDGQEFHKFFTVLRHENNTATATFLGQNEGPRIYLKSFGNGIFVAHHCKPGFFGEVAFVGFLSCGTDLSTPARLVADILTSDPDVFEIDNEQCPI